MNAGELSGASMGSLLSGPEAEGLGWYGHWYGHSFAETIPRTDSWSWAADPEDHWCGGILFRVRILPTERRACAMTQLVSYEGKSQKILRRFCRTNSWTRCFAIWPALRAGPVSRCPLPALDNTGPRSHVTVVIAAVIAPYCGGKSLLDLGPV